MRWSILIVAIAVALGRIIFKNYAGLLQLYTQEFQDGIIHRIRVAYTAPDQRHLDNPAAKNQPEHIFVEKTSTVVRNAVKKMSTSTTNGAARTIRKSFLASQQSEGAGAVVRRSIGTPQLKNLSPFLMLDHFTIPPSAGFPDHPHRGQETITYLLSGSVDHEDFAGNKGTIYPGDLQFMTAGRGIVHAEMPGQGHGDQKIEGMQLWVDLPEELKMCEPRYRDLRSTEIPEVKLDDDKVSVKVISGKSHGVDSVKDLAYTPVWILDITIQPGGRIEQELPSNWNAFAYTLEGTTIFGSSNSARPVGQFHNVVFNTEGGHVIASVAEDADEPARFFLVAGQPLDQRVVQYGPFVLTSNEGVYQAMEDYQGRKGGFERAEGWRSEIGKRMM